MELKLDVKTLVIGIVLGVIITAVLGAGVGSADATRFGIAIEPKGAALVRTSGGDFYVVNPQTAMAVRVLEASNLKAEPDDNRNSKGRPFNSSGVSRSGRTSTKY